MENNLIDTFFSASAVGNADSLRHKRFPPKSDMK